MGEKNRPSKKKYDWFNAITGKFNLDDIVKLSYFMAFNMPVNEAQKRRKSCSLTLREEPSVIFISQPGEHIHYSVDKDGGWGWVEGVSVTQAPGKTGDHHLV